MVKLIKSTKFSKTKLKTFGMSSLQERNLKRELLKTKSLPRKINLD